MDASEPTPPEGENVTEESTVYQSLLERTVRFELEHIASECWELSNRVDELEDDELLEELSQLEEHAAVLRQIVEEREL